MSQGKILVLLAFLNFVIMTVAASHPLEADIQLGSQLGASHMAAGTHAENAINYQATLKHMLENGLTDTRVDFIIVPVGKGELVCQKI